MREGSCQNSLNISLTFSLLYLKLLFLFDALSQGLRAVTVRFLSFNIIYKYECVAEFKLISCVTMQPLTLSSPVWVRLYIIVVPILVCALFNSSLISPVNYPDYTRPIINYFKFTLLFIDIIICYFNTKFVRINTNIIVNACPSRYYTRNVILILLLQNIFYILLYFTDAYTLLLSVSNRPSWNYLPDGVFLLLYIHTYKHVIMKLYFILLLWSVSDCCTRTSTGLVLSIVIIGTSCYTLLIILLFAVLLRLWIVCLCMYICVCACMYVFIIICMRIYVCACMHMCVWVYMDLYMCYMSIMITDGFVRP